MRSYPSADEHYERLGLTPLSEAELKRIIGVHAREPTVQRMAAAHAGLRDQGDDASNRAFYAVFYEDRVPELNVPCLLYTSPSPRD